MATSANFGNMFSMAGASLFLPFLPLLPKQILLTNLLTDFPEMTIATDNVDPELVARPRRWDIGFIRTLHADLRPAQLGLRLPDLRRAAPILHAGTEQFRTGWFVESVVSAALVVLVIRSRRPFFRSRPGTHLLLATFAVVAATWSCRSCPSPAAGPDAAAASRSWLCSRSSSLVYVATAEVAKRFFYRVRHAA